MIYVELNLLDLILLVILFVLIIFVAWDLALDIVTSIMDKRRAKKKQKLEPLMIDGEVRGYYFEKGAK